MCDTVAVIEAGRIQATGDVSSVIKGVRPHNEIFVRTLEGPETTERRLVELPFVGKVRHDRGGLVFDFEGTTEEMADLLEQLVRSGARVLEFASKDVDLEDVFLSLTQGKVQ